MFHIGSDSPVATFFSPACKILISSNHRCRKNTIDHQKASCSGFFHQSLGVFTENKYPGIGSDVHQHTGPLITAHLQKPRKNPSQNKRIHSLQWVHEIREYPWGQRDIRVYDPDKHIVEIAEDMTTVIRRFFTQGMYPPCKISSSS